VIVVVGCGCAPSETCRCEHGSDRESDQFLIRKLYVSSIVVSSRQAPSFIDAGTDTELMSELPNLSRARTEMGSYEGPCPAATSDFRRN
jgi:hypothetical protein